MIFKRCPSCRTICDADLDVRCFACGGDLATAGPMAPVRRPQLLHAARKDRKASSALLVVLAIFGMVGVSMLALNPGISLAARIGIGVLLVVAVVFGIILPGESVRRPVLKVFATFGVVILAGAAAILGLLLVLFVACAIGGTPSFR